MHDKNYISRFAKTTYNLERMEYRKRKNEKGRQKIKERRQTCYMGPISCSGLTYFVESDEKNGKVKIYLLYGPPNFHNRLM